MPVYDIETIKVRLSVAEPTGPTGETASKSEDAAAILRPLFADLSGDQEHVILLAVDCRNRVTGFAHICSGGQSGAQADPAIIFRRALMLGAKGIILSHNHPSGDPSPSRMDLVFTEKLQAGATLLGLNFLDHIILTADGRYKSVLT